MKYFSCVLFIATCITTTCLGQTNDSQTNTVWGPSLGGAKMSIAVTNAEIALSSSVVLQCQIQNSSTNLVSMRDTGLTRYDFYVSLVDNSGKQYDVGPNDRSMRPIFVNIMADIKPGEIYKCNIPVQFDSISRSTISPGIYYFRVTRGIEVQGASYLLTSNDLKVDVQ